MSTKPHLSQIQSTDMLKHPHLLDEVLEMLENLSVLASRGLKGIFNTYADMEAGAKEEGFYKVVIDETFRDYSVGYYYNGTDFQINYGFDLVVSELEERIVDIEGRMESSEGLIESITIHISNIKESIERNTRDIRLLDEALLDASGELNILINDLLEVLGDWRSDEELKEKLTESIKHVANVIGVNGLKRTVVFYVESFFNEEKSIGIYVPYKGRMDKLYVSIPEAIPNDLLVRFTVGEVVEDITLPAGDKLITVDIEGNLDNNNCIFTVLSGGELRGINASLDFIQTS